MILSNDFEWILSWKLSIPTSAGYCHRCIVEIVSSVIRQWIVAFFLFSCEFSLRALYLCESVSCIIHDEKASQNSCYIKQGKPQYIIIAPQRTWRDATANSSPGWIATGCTCAVASLLVRRHRRHWQRRIRHLRRARLPSWLTFVAVCGTRRL